MSACSSCGAPVLWARTLAAGGWIPLNPDPIIGGNLELKDGVARYVKPSGTVALYTSHFANCPNADAHRKERRR
ncbi:MAG TPA: hypothetical protein VNU21_12530 [Usitatibacter sp.]|nr:hypothetical protein [Usitatibacter sp.]